MRAGIALAGRYVLQEEIGVGGQGVVWRASDPRLGRDVAMKQVRLTQLPPDEMRNARARLVREAQTAARVVHGNVVSVFDSVEHDGEPWLVLEYVPSRNLKQVVRQRGLLAPIEAARIGARVADGLAAAHAVGVEHRDVKPANVLLTDRGQVKLTDFGIARAVGDVSLTRSGVLSATLPYLAVEVARGYGWSTAADVWALGATLYAALEGDPPFGNDQDDIRLLHKIMSGVFDPPRNAGQLTATLMQLLATDPTVRPDAAAAARLLDDFADGRGGRATGPPVPPSGAARGQLVGPPLSASTPARPGWFRRNRIRLAVLAVLTVVIGAGAAAATIVGPQILAAISPDEVATQPAPPPSLIGDPRTADPCSLLTESSVRRFGRTTTYADYGGPNGCAVQVVGQDPGSVELSASLALRDPNVPPDGAATQLGSLTVFREPAQSTQCSRTVALPDNVLVYVYAVAVEGAKADLCAIAEAGTSTTVTALSTNAVARKTVPDPPDALTQLDMCALADASIVARVPGLDTTRRQAGFGNWACYWGDNPAFSYAPQVDVEVRRLAELTGTPVPIAGRTGQITPSTESGYTECSVALVHRTFTAPDGTSRVEYLGIRVYGGQQPTPDAACQAARSIAEAVAPKLPPAS